MDWYCSLYHVDGWIGIVLYTMLMVGLVLFSRDYFFFFFSILFLPIFSDAHVCGFYVLYVVVKAR